MAELDRIDRSEDELRRASAHPRAVGSPLPRGGVPHSGLPDAAPEPGHFGSLPPGRALTSGSAPADSADSTMQKAMNAFRSAIPFVQRLLPLLDGNFATAIANVFTAQQAAQKPAPPPVVDLTPVQDSVLELQAQQRDLHDQVFQQNVLIQKFEDQMQMVREATDRNTLEQQELMEDLKAVGHKVNIIALIALALLGVSVLLNLFLYLHIQRVLP